MAKKKKPGLLTLDEIRENLDSYSIADIDHFLTQIDATKAAYEEYQRFNESYQQLYRNTSSYNYSPFGLSNMGKKLDFDGQKYDFSQAYHRLKELKGAWEDLGGGKPDDPELPAFRMDLKATRALKDRERVADLEKTRDAKLDQQKDRRNQAASRGLSGRVAPILASAGASSGTMGGFSSLLGLDMGLSLGQRTVLGG